MNFYIGDIVKSKTNIVWVREMIVLNGNYFEDNILCKCVEYGLGSFHILELFKC